MTHSCRTVSLRTVRMWCERQWLVATCTAGVAFCITGALALFDHYAAASVAGSVSLVACGAAVAAAHIGRRFTE